MLALALAATLATSAPVARVVPERRYDARLVRVIDGDSIEVAITARATTHLPGQDIDLSTSVVETVRLAGVNAPETHGKCDAEKASTISHAKSGRSWRHLNRPGSTQAIRFGTMASNGSGGG